MNFKMLMKAIYSSEPGYYTVGVGTCTAGGFRNSKDSAVFHFLDLIAEKFEQEAKRIKDSVDN